MSVTFHFSYFQGLATNIKSKTQCLSIRVPTFIFILLFYFAAPKAINGDLKYPWHNLGGKGGKDGFEG